MLIAECHPFINRGHNTHTNAASQHEQRLEQQTRCSSATLPLLLQRLRTIMWAATTQYHVLPTHRLPVGLAYLSVYRQAYTSGRYCHNSIICNIVFLVYTRLNFKGVLVHCEGTSVHCVASSSHDCHWRNAVYVIMRWIIVIKKSHL